MALKALVSVLMISSRLLVLAMVCEQNKQYDRMYKRMLCVQRMRHLAVQKWIEGN
jgi:hypothetical protein